MQHATNFHQCYAMTQNECPLMKVTTLVFKLIFKMLHFPFRLFRVDAVINGEFSGLIDVICWLAIAVDVDVNA
jgi:hypothetical protein